MKIRNGFVSNSSSSSFVIKLKAYKDVFSLAQAMIKIRDEEDGGFKTPSPSLKEFAKKFDRNCPVSFRTMEFDTYIYRTNDGYVVNSCHNHNWSKLMGISYFWNEDNIPTPEEEKMVETMSKEFNDEFLFLEIGEIGKITKNWCKECWGDFIAVKDSNKIICSGCKKELKS